MFRESSLFGFSKPESPQPTAQESYKVKGEVDEQHVRAELNQIVPGAVQYLANENNISHFARYPLQLLVDMYQAKDSSKPWGLVIASKDDHNGAFYHSGALNKLHRSIGSEIHTRVVETASVQEATALAEKLAGRFGPASYLILRGHGNEMGIQFGAEGEEGSELQHPDADPMQESETTEKASISEFADSIKGVLLPGAGICFDSCSTGASDESIAQELATQSGHDTAAPTGDSGMIDLGAQVVGRVVKFQPKYHEASTRMSKAA